MAASTSNLPSVADLPIHVCLDELQSALAGSNCAVLIAPPGAGKSTRVPLALLDAPWRSSGKIIMLEPRRIAARSVATYMASLLGEAVGQTIGYRVRLDTKVSSSTKIEVVTEGVFTRMILDDPSLDGVLAVLFDEFHERSLEGDLGLALALDVQSALREDLRILAMSATLDGAHVARLMGDPPVVQSEGRGFPIEYRYQPKSGDEAIETTITKAIRETLIGEDGSILCFLPGQREILRTAELLQDRLPANCFIAPLYGALSSQEQDLAIKPAEAGTRKIVLASNIAETSLTIDGVRVVIDSGLARVPRYEPATGVTRLVTERASLSSVNQRAGRAGRTAPGIALRLWHEGQNGALPKHDRPEILDADLSNLVLSLSSFGVRDPKMLNWMDAPPKPAWDEAINRLKLIDAIDAQGNLTLTGKQLSALPFLPHLAAMVYQTTNAQEASLAARLAMLVTERGLGGNDIDIAQRFEKFKSDQSRRAKQVRGLASNAIKSLAFENPRDTRSIGALLSLAFPDRIAVQRGAKGRYVMVNGRGVALDEASSLAREKYLVVCDLQGSATQARILSATAITKDEIIHNHDHKMEMVSNNVFLEKERRVESKTVRKLGNLILSEQVDSDVNPEAVTSCLISGIQKIGLDCLSWDKDATRLRGQLAFLHARAPDEWLPVNNDELTAALSEWLASFIPGKSSIREISATDLIAALLNRQGLHSAKQLQQLLPTHFSAPSGSNIPIRYEENEAILPIRVQELYGLKTHPTILDGKVPLMLELLSPAQRPIQKTADLAGFWAGSWKDVRAEMRGRYPKHPWPEDPANAMPTARAKPRK